MFVIDTGLHLLDISFALTRILLWPSSAPSPVCAAVAGGPLALPGSYTAQLQLLLLPTCSYYCPAAVTVVRQLPLPDRPSSVVAQLFGLRTVGPSAAISDWHSGS
jgi:hypothetical protein